MAKKKSEEAKRHIFNAAVDLFASKGYSAVGVREIAKNAGANLSMISYYFDGKIGILKAIIKEYFENLSEIINSVVDEKSTIEEFIESLVPKIVEFMKNNAALCKVALLEMPRDLPEIKEYKIKVFELIAKVIREQVWAKTGIKDNPEKYIPIIGPAMISMVYSNFMLGELIAGSFKTKFDKKFYENYSKIITIMLLNGINGIRLENKSKEIKK